MMQLVGGSSALALAMTVVSNLLGIMIVSFLFFISTRKYSFLRFNCLF